MEKLGMVIDLCGSIMIAYAALRVHHRVLNEHKIDKHVYATMVKEQRVGILGVGFLLMGFVLQFFS